MYARTGVEHERLEPRGAVVKKGGNTAVQGIVFGKKVATTAIRSWFARFASTLHQYTLLIEGGTTGRAKGDRALWDGLTQLQGQGFARPGFRMERREGGR